MQGKRTSFCWAPGRLAMTPCTLVPSGRRAASLCALVPSGRRAASLCALVLSLSAAPAAAADPQITVSPGDPTGVTPITVTAAVGEETASGSTVEVAVEPGIQQCPSDPSSGSGQILIEPSQPPASSTPLTLVHGDYNICGWVLDPSDAVVDHNHVPLHVRNSDAISLKLPASTVVDGAMTTVTATGVADVLNAAVYVTRKPAAKDHCAANPAADSGTPLPGFDPAMATFGRFMDSSTVALGSGLEGPDAEPPGTYRLCAWLMDADGSTKVPLAPVASTTVTLTAPTGTLAYSLGGQLVRVGARFPIEMSYSTSASDAILYLDVKRLPARGRLCAGSHAADRGAVKTIVVTTPDQRTSSLVRAASPGVYVTCAWLEWPHGTIDGPFSGRFVVAARHQRAALYYGLTSQKIPRSKLRSSAPIVFQAIDGQIVNLSYFARYTCTIPGKPTTHPTYVTSFPAFAQISPSLFGDTFVSGSDRSVISGHIRRRRATGTLSESYTSGRYRCRSGTVRFTARRA